jgi:hypothetical protein
MMTASPHDARLLKTVCIVAGVIICVLAIAVNLRLAVTHPQPDPFFYDGYHVGAHLSQLKGAYTYDAASFEGYYIHWLLASGTESVERYPNQEVRDAVFQRFLRAKGLPQP